MKVSLVVREGSGNNRRYSKFNKKKIYPEGTVFCLRYQRKFETLKVTDQTAALAARAIKEAALLTGQPSSASAPAKRISIDDAIIVYLSNIAATKKHKTWLAYSRATSEFRESCTKQFMDEITKDDLTAFVIAQKKKVSDRTIDNRLTDLGTFLHANNIKLSLHHAFTKKKVKAYVLEELRALNAVSTDEELQIWQFFLGTGFREGETAHACYTDIDFAGKTISVLIKPEFNWEPKDKEERTVPIPDSLIELLKVRKAINPGRWLIFPNGQGNPEGHFLRLLKLRAFAAGLNCGHCVRRIDGKAVSCADGPHCKTWKLHKFRKAFATMHNANRVPVPTIQGWLGHSSIQTCLLYIADAAIDTPETRAQVNGSFAAVDAEEEEK